MDGIVDIYLDRALNEIKAAQILFEISNDKNKKLSFKIDEESTFYSSVISHSYYSIFFASQAILRFKEIKVTGSNIHKKTYEAFEEHLVKTGFLDKSFLEIYKTLIICAEDLLNIFDKEKSKRSKFTYQTLPQANFGPSNSSIENAKKFLSNIIKVIEVERKKQKESNE